MIVTILFSKMQRFNETLHTVVLQSAATIWPTINAWHYTKIPYKLLCAPTVLF